MKAFFRKLGRIAAAPIVSTTKAAKKGTEKLMKDAILGIVRHVLTTAGGALIGAGYIDGTELQAAVGAVVTLLGLILSIIDKRKRITT